MMLLVHGCRRTRFPNNLYLTTATQKRLRCEWSGTTCLVEISLFLFLSLFLFFATSFGTVALPHTHPPTRVARTHDRSTHLGIVGSYILQQQKKDQKVGGSVLSCCRWSPLVRVAAVQYWRWSPSQRRSIVVTVRRPLYQQCGVVWSGAEWERRNAVELLLVGEEDLFCLRSAVN